MIQTQGRYISVENTTQTQRSSPMEGLFYSLAVRVGKHEAAQMSSEGVGHGEPQPVDLVPGRAEALVVVLQLSIELLRAGSISSVSTTSGRTNLANCLKTCRRDQ